MEPFKNWLNEVAAERIANAIQRSYPKFSKNIFLKNIELELKPLEFKDRAEHLKNKFSELLPEDPRITIPLLVESLKTDESDTVGLNGFQAWPISHYIAQRGLNHFEISMEALYKLTQVFTGEFAIRPFLIQHEQETLKILNRWTGDSNEHVRRLVSEGSRPLLPWGIKIPSFVKNPEKTWGLLEQLKNDPAKYVQKSVANHINDHSKNHGDWLLKKLSLWDNKNPIQCWIIRHGSRTLIKKGHPKALKLHNIKPVKIKVSQKLKTSKIKIGQALVTELKIQNLEKSKVNILIDHEILFLKSNGKHSPKVFKGKKITLEKGESQIIAFRIPLRKVTTRTYYPGTHFWASIINGKKQKTIRFQLSI